MKQKSIIGLLTDFGTRDNYVAQMKGAILTIMPDAVLVDITHEIPPFQIMQAAYVLVQSIETFPRGTVFACVVDPGVGTSRRPIALSAGGYFFVGPDNGLFSLVDAKFQRWAVRALTNPRFWRKQVSSTFHGRDIFGPIAAHLAKNGRIFDVLGPSLKKIYTFRDAFPASKDKGLEGRIIHIDHFGNLISNIEKKGAPSRSRVYWRGKKLGAVNATYGEVARGALLAVWNSAGFLELAVREGSCAAKTKAKVGECILLRA